MIDETRSNARFTGLLVGLLVMAVGVVLLLDRTGFVRLFGHSTIWPFLVITGGLVKLSRQRAAGRREGGWWLFFGVWMLLNDLRILRFRDSWPLVLVAIGISMIWKEVVRRRLPGHERVG